MPAAYPSTAICTISNTYRVFLIIQKYMLKKAAQAICLRRFGLQLSSDDSEEFVPRFEARLIGRNELRLCHKHFRDGVHHNLLGEYSRQFDVRSEHNKV